MASQGPLSGGTFADDATVGTVAWSNPGSAAASDDTWATAIMGLNVVSHYLKATNFGFSIPSGATIDGIVVEIERAKVTGALGHDNSVKIVKGGTISGTEKAVGTNWPGVDTYATYGSSADLWGLAWTDTDINASGFGVVISGVEGGSTSFNARVDHIRITVYYTGGGPPPPVVTTDVFIPLVPERTVT